MVLPPKSNCRELLQHQLYSTAQMDQWAARGELPASVEATRALVLATAQDVSGILHPSQALPAVSLRNAYSMAVVR